MAERHFTFKHMSMSLSTSNGALGNKSSRLKLTTSVLATMQIIQTGRRNMITVNDEMSSKRA